MMKIIHKICSPGVPQVLEVLHTVAKKEKVDLPEEFAKRLVVYANRNMRR
jgi:hypothetical protein